MNKRVKRLLLAAAALILLAVSIAFYLLRSTAARVATLHEEIRASGDPLYFTEYDAAPIEDEENAYYHFMRAKPSLEAFNASLVEVLSDPVVELRSPDSLSKPLIDAIDDRLSDQEEAFAHLDRAAACQNYRIDIDRSKGFAAEAPHPTAFQLASRAFACRSIVLASRGKGDEALDMCVRGLRVQRLMLKDSMLITYLAAISGEDELLTVAHHVIHGCPTTPEARSRLDQALAEIDHEGALANTFKVERSLGLLTFQQVRGEGDESLDDVVPLPGFLRGTGLGVAYVNEDEASYIGYLNKYIELVRKPKVERTPVLDAIQQELSGRSYRKAMTQMMVPTLGNAIDAMDDVESRLRCLRILLRIHGQENADLGWLNERVRTDPFSRKPLLIKKQREGWLVYGVGRNLKDDQGDLTWSNGMNSSLDVGFGPGTVSWALGIAPID